LLAPSRFARTAVCEYCRAVVQIDEASVSAEMFRAAHRQWSAPSPLDARSWIAVGDDRWTPIALLGRGEIADVHLVERARQPTERARLKVLRDPDDLPMLDAEWSALARLQVGGSFEILGSPRRLPQRIARATIDSGDRAGAHATVTSWASGFDHTFEAVRTRHPRGVDARVGLWMWRRMLETLAALHAAGLVHGAVLPQHLLVERGEHGVRLVGFGCAGYPGEPLAAIVASFERLYAPALLATQRLAPAHDVVMSARCIAYVLGADAGGRVPSTVPAPFRALIESAANGSERGGAWELHERVGALARELFGAPSFHPLEMT
jgi:hypothetical protein